MCGTALPDICFEINSRLAAQVQDSILDVDVVSDDELVLVPDEVGHSKHLPAPTVDRCAGVLGSLESRRDDFIWSDEPKRGH